MLRPFLEFPFNWLVSAGDGSRGNAQPIPAIDGCDGQREVSEFLFTELLAGFFVHGIRNMRFRDPGDGFCPSQCSAFSVAVIRRFFPGIERIQALLAFADGSQVLPVHVETIRAAVDLRAAEPDEVQKRFFQSALMKVFFQSDHCLVNARRYFSEIETRFHTAILR